jgi:NAD(P)-dependent dehydrogenase (short-subunit alcohol dehydrogenase family)
MRLKNKIAIITGAAKGMGSAITRTLGREGADMMLAARDIEPLEEVAAEVRAMGRRVETISADVTDPKQVEAMVERTKEAFGGRIDILVNVAGTTGPIETPIQDIDPDDFLEVLDINVRGTFLPIKYALPTMIAQKYGKIVNIGGSSGLRGYKYRTAYSSSKWALRGLTSTIALEVGPHNVNVNIVMPGIVHTPRMDKLCEEKAKVRGWTFERVYQEYVEEMCLGRVTEPEDVADAVLYCASDESKNMTGQKISVDGGWDV